MSIRHAQPADLSAIIASRRAGITGRMATTYTEPVMVTARQPWIREIDPAVRLLWVLTDSLIRAKGRWFFMRSLYLRPTYAATVAVVDYSDPTARPRGVERNLAILGRRAQ